MNEKTRAYIYRVFLALAAVAVGYGLLSDTQAVLWVAVATAVLGNGLATANTSTDPKNEDGITAIGLILVVLVVLVVAAVIGAI